MDSRLSKRFKELSDELKELFKELDSFQTENERLTKENISLREEVAMLRLYIDTYMQEGEPPADLEALDLSPAAGEAAPPSISEDALAFYNSLPQSFNFSELFELADLLGVDKHKMKGYMTTYLRENLMQQHGTRVEKTGDSRRLWERSLKE